MRRSASSRRGLSPRVRGNPPPILSGANGHGSIPACAGEPRCFPAALRLPTVYPRVCGGTSTHPLRSHLHPGLSPACAGEPGTCHGLPSATRVYPRVCGGTCRRGWNHEHQLGLSPRVRGNHERARPDGNLVGSIPACAGEPGTAQGIARRAAVYPRVCGGTFPQVADTGDRLGLSPRVRGNLSMSGSVEGALRSIPACAGEPLDI